MKQNREKKNEIKSWVLERATQLINFYLEGEKGKGTNYQE